MTYDYELVLISQAFIEDEIGNRIPTETRKTVLCNVKSVGRNEFYSAATAGLKPSIVFVIHGYEYDGEQEVEFEGARYRVIRTYSTDFEEIEITCERVAADG
ncbi:phage head closure protein [Anoxybacillus flavithermus]|uniref:Prophage pi2 protein n=1 Tax=Anoxybacillus flavithermus (strain DSM 21510 / WK1) TaxID=491915 RepID=B7GIN3_ANOFW|nr:phage head closure protein [Anoxybacillus flavithermus]ACJ33048.1 Prophage pi2 protein [Anoxybacillus flavithermus WK1]